MTVLKILTYALVILGQLRMGARQAKNAPLISLRIRSRPKGGMDGETKKQGEKKLLSHFVMKG